MHYTLCDYLLDVFQNALEAGSERTDVLVREETRDAAAVERRTALPATSRPAAWIAVEIRDSGRGMTDAEQRRALDPFVTDGEKHPGRRVGLGLPFLAQIVDATGGRLELDSTPGAGTRVAFELDGAHIDAPPLGDLPATFLQMMCFEGDYEVVIDRELGAAAPAVSGGQVVDDGRPTGRSYRLSRHELRDALGDLETAASLTLLRQYLVQQETELHDTED